VADAVSRNWTCPHCDRPQTLSPAQTFEGDMRFRLAENIHGEVGILVHATACANPECREVTSKIWFCSGELENQQYGSTWKPKAVISNHAIRPSGSSKPQPEYIPLPLREDYLEACLIRDQSPKAAATLARRCLQGMIRDFAKISRPTLFAEVKALSELVEAEKAPPGVSSETVEAIDYVRSIGNIGAHMEKDIDVIVPVDAGEAQALIELIELLFEEWYVARFTRSQKLLRVKQIAEEKMAAKQLGHAVESNEG